MKKWMKIFGLLLLTTLSGVTVSAQGLPSDNLYTLEVNSGTGSGSYTYGDEVLITATAPAGTAFTRWTGDTQCVAGVFSLSTIVTMPASNVTLTASFVDAPSGVVNITWGASAGFYFSANTNAGILGPVDSGKSTIAQLMYSPDDIKDNISPSRAGTTNDVVWDTIILTENGIPNSESDWAFFTNHSTIRTWTNGYVYALIFQDNNVQSGDWYFSTPLLTLLEIVSPALPQSIEMNTVTNGDAIDGAYGARVAGVLLTVIGGDGSGSYTNGQQVAIAANQWSNRTFVAWIGDTQYVSGVTASNTTVTLPAATNYSVTLTATYDQVILTVNDGIGSGTYTKGQQVAIAANAAPANQVFDRWTGDTQVVASVTSVITTVTIPVQDVSLTATYKNIPNLYTLTVNNGTGSGAYTNETQVLIAASNAPTGQAFARWIGDTQYVASVTSSPTTVTMPSNAVSLTATYTNLPGWNTLTVNSGTGSGSYTNGAQVTITANVLTNQAFDRWTGANQYVERESASPTIVTMPAWAITLTATYRPDTNRPTLKITAPAAKAKILATNGLFTIRGTATDNRTVADVQVKLNDDDYVSAATSNGWKTWSLPVELISGTNTILAYSVDSAVNSSLISTVKCTYAETTSFTIETTGKGRVTLSPGGKPEVGKSYTLTASPANGSVFSEWTGYIVSTDRVVMFTMPLDETITANFSDIQKPTVKITYPTKSQRVMTNGTVVIRGTATDNYGLSNVVYQLYTGGWANAVMSNDGKNWTAEFYPEIGLNTARVYSVDVYNYVSAISTVVFTYMPGAVIEVQTIGAGTIKPNYNGQVLEIGKSYTMTAKAVKNTSVFSDWTYGVTDLVTSAESKITFVMQSNLVLTANFNSISERAALASAVFDVPTKVIGLSGSIAFGSVPVGGASNRTLTVSNSGNTALTVTNISYPACFSGAWSGTIGAGASTNVVVTFTPAAVTNYSGTVTVSSDATSGTNTISASGTGTVPTAPVITTVSPLPSGTAGNYYSQTLTAVGGITPYSWSLHSAVLPAGLSLNSAGVISGTPEAVGTMNFAVRVTDRNDLFSIKTVRLTITATEVGTAPVITTLSPLPPGTVGNYYSQTLAAVGGTTPYNWSLYSISLPAGLSLNSAGVISGTPEAAGTMNFVVRVTGSNDLYSTVMFRLTIAAAPTAPAIMTVSPLPPGAVGATYNRILKASGGTMPYSWSLSSGSLPSGLTLSRGGAISGMPSAAETANFTVQVTGGDGLSSTNAFSLTTTDAKNPVLKITAPAAKAKILATNKLFTVCGTAADNWALINVMVQLNGGTWTNAVTTNGWINWSLPVTLMPGMNTIRAYSVDAAVNNSRTSTVAFTCVPGAVIEVQANGAGTIKPNYNGQVLEIGRSYKMTAKAASFGSAFTDWTYGIGGPVASAGSKITFVMQSNLVLTANFISISEGAAVADRAIDMPAAAQAEIVVDGSAKEWANVPRSSFSYASVTQEVAVALDGKNIALLLTGCPFNTSDNVLVYFKLRLSYGDGDNRHSVDLWTSGSVLYGMVDGQVITGLEAVLLNGVLEVKLPVEQAPSQVTIEEIGCGMDLGTGTLTELFKLTPPPAFSQ